MLKINVTNLKKYNEGALVGEWVSLPHEGLEEVKIYFDYEAYGRDMEINGTFIQIDNSFVELY